MKRFLLLCLTTLLAGATWAYDVYDEDSGLYFNVTVGGFIVTTGPEPYETEIVVIPDTILFGDTYYPVLGVGESAFEDCSSLEEVTIGKYVTSLARYAFGLCHNLVTVNSLNPVPPTCEDSGVFSNYNATLYVPRNSISDYRADEVWGSFVQITAYVDESLPTVVTEAATDVTQTTAILHGTVSGGDVEIIEQGFEYTTGNGTILSITAEGEDMSAFIENLSSGTTYAFRAYAQCSDDIAYGDELTFTTMSDYDLLSDGLYYRITSSSQKTCAVTCLYLSSDNGDVYTGEITIPESVKIDDETYTVTGIDDYAFYYCRNLTSVTIPETVTSIGDYAFYYCRNLTSVTLPETVTSIGTYAFLNCGLTEINIPNNVTSIGTYAFRNSTSLLKASIGNGMKTVPEGMFYNCTKLEEVTITDNITGIGRESFAFCSSLKEFTIPETVTSIGNLAFYGCSSLTAIVVPDGVTSLNYTFDQCTALEEVTLGKNLKTLGQEVFYKCSSLKEITIPDAVTSIGPMSFDSCSGLTDVKFGSGLKELGSSAFSGCTSLPSITIPGSVETIGSSAFNKCTSLTEVTLVEGVKEIGNSAFSGCTSLPSITIPGSVESIGSSAFYNCTSLTEVTLVEGLKELGSSAFSGCNSLPSITIPGSVETMGSSAFSNCDILSDVTMNEGLKEIGSYAFYKCISLPSITIPGSVESIGYDAFAYCDILSDVTMNEGLKEIGIYAFYKCISLPSITIPGSVETIGSSAFAYCYGLTDATMNEGLKEIGYDAFYHCEALASTKIPQTVESIGSGSFMYCYSLTEVKVGNNATEIDSDAFSYCSSLTNVSLGKSLETLGQTVFRNCSSLAKFYSLNPEPASAPYANVFNNIYDRCVLYIPLGSYEAYETKKPDYSSSKLWADSFYKIIELADVETLEATSVTETSATLHGTFEVGELCETTTSKGFEIWEEANPDNVIIRLVSGDSLTCVVDGLSLETTYIYHAFVSTATSSSYGDDVEFTTLSIPGTFVCMVEPTKGTDVDELSQLAFYNPLIGEEIFINEELARDPEIHVYNEAGDVVTSISYFDTIFSTDFTKEYAQIAVFEDTVTEGGTYTVSVPAEQFIIYDENGKTYYNEAMTLTYTIVGDTTGINGISTNLDSENVEGIYSTSGQKLNSTVKGVNIIRYTDGTVKKIYVK